MRRLNDPFSRPHRKPQNHAPCPSCHGSSFDPPLPSVEPAFSIARCADCGLGRTAPAPSEDEIGNWYPAQYYGKENIRFNPLFEKMVRWFRRRRAEVIHDRVPHGPVLDVGCGRGLMLSYLRDMGYEPHGLELSDTAATHARTALKIPVVVDDFVRMPHERDRYNAVIFWHSLEHFSHPVGAIARAYESLKPGGVLCVAVPNFASWQARLFGRHWFHLDIPRHYFHFSPRSLQYLLHRQGFRIVQTDHFSFEQNPYGIMQSLYNALGFRHNLLYSLLKDRSARGVELWHHPIQSATIALLLPFFLTFAFAATLIETALRSGGTFEVYAFKE